MVFVKGFITGVGMWGPARAKHRHIFLKTALVAVCVILIAGSAYADWWDNDWSNKSPIVICAPGSAALASNYHVTINFPSSRISDIDSFRLVYNAGGTLTEIDEYTVDYHSISDANFTVSFRYPYPLAAGTCTPDAGDDESGGISGYYNNSSAVRDYSHATDWDANYNGYILPDVVGGITPRGGCTKSFNDGGEILKLTGGLCYWDDARVTLNNSTGTTLQVRVRNTNASTSQTAFVIFDGAEVEYAYPNGTTLRTGSVGPTAWNGDSTTAYHTYTMTLKSGAYKLYADLNPSAIISEDPPWHTVNFIRWHCGADDTCYYDFVRQDNTGAFAPVGFRVGGEERGQYPSIALIWDGGTRNVFTNYLINWPGMDVNKSWSMPSSAPFGAAWDGNYLWVVDYADVSPFIPRILKMNLDGGLLGTYNLPTTYPIDAIWDGSNVWVAYYNARKICKYDTSIGFSEIACYDNPPDLNFGNVQGMTYFHNEFWVTGQGMGSTMYKIDPIAGQILDSKAIPCTEPTGLTDDETNIYCTEQNWGSQNIVKYNMSDGTTEVYNFAFKHMGLEFIRNPPLPVAPVVSDIPNIGMDEGATDDSIDLDDYVTDADTPYGEIIAWGHSGNTDINMAIDAYNVVILTPNNANWCGTETITFTATDKFGLSDSDDSIVTVACVNDAPVVIDRNEMVIEDTPTATNLDAYVSDVDHTDAEMTWSVVGSANIAASVAGNILTLTPAADFCNETFSEKVVITATDSGTWPPGALSDSGTINVRVTCVNDAPVVSGIPDVTFDEDADTNQSDANFSLNPYVTDVDNSDNQVSWSYSGNVNVGVTISPLPNRNVYFSIPPNWHGSEIITFTATDLGGLSDSDDINVTVESVNDIPAASITSPVDGSIFTEGTLIIFSGSATDIEDGTLSGSFLRWMSSIDGLIGTGNAFITILSPGNHTITLTATDLETVTGTATINMSIIIINTPPNISGIPDITVDEDSGLNDNIIDLREYASDAQSPDENLSFAITLQSNPAIIGCVVDSGRYLDCTTQSNKFGHSDVEVMVQDPQGLADMDAFRIIVTAINDAPIFATLPNVDMNEDSQTGRPDAFDLDDYVTDPDLIYGDALNYFVSGAGCGPGLNIGFAIDSDNNADVGTPTPDASGICSFTIRVEDGNIEIDTGSFIVTVIPVNDAPVVIDTSAEMIEDTPIVLKLDDYLSDIDNADAEMIWSVAAAPADANATVDNATRTLTITPNANYCGTDSLTIQATDLGMLNDTGVLSLSIACVNDVPVFAPLPNIDMNEDSPTGRPDAFDLDNYASDADGDALSYSTVGSDCGDLISAIAIDTENRIDAGTPLANKFGNCIVTIGVSETISDWYSGWAQTQQNGISVSGSNGILTISGTATSCCWNNEGRISKPLNSDYVQVEMSSTDLIASANSASVWISKDSQNALIVEKHRDVTDPQYNTAVFVVEKINGNNNFKYVSPEAPSANFDKYKVEKIAGGYKVYYNESLVYTGNLDLTQYNTVQLVGLARATGDQIETKFRNYSDSTSAVAATSAFTITVLPVNDAPIVADIPDVTMYEDAQNNSIDLGYYVGDVDNTIAEIVWAASGNANISVNIDSVTHVVTLTPTANWYGTETITFIASDGYLNDSDAAVITVLPVNDSPVATISTPANDSSFTEGSVIAFSGLAMDVEDGNILGAALQWTSSIDGAIGDGNTLIKVLSSGSHTITLTATDSEALAGIAQISVNITVINTPPNLAGIPDTAVDEDSGLNDNVVDLWAYASDAQTPDNALVFSINSQSNSELVDCVVDVGRYIDCTTLQQDESGSSNVTVMVVDADGLGDIDVFTVAVQAINDLPSAMITAPASGSGFSDQDNITFSGNASDVEDGLLAGAALQWSSDIDGALGTGESVVATLSGGTHTITLTATDANGGTGNAIITLNICATPRDDLVISNSMSMCSGSYNVVDTAGDGAIVIDNDAITLDCENAHISGDGTGRGIVVNGYIPAEWYVEGNTGGFLDAHKIAGNEAAFEASVTYRQGITIRNCEVSGYEYGFAITGGDGITVENATAHDNAGVGIGFQGLRNSSIRNNFVYGNSKGGIIILLGKNNVTELNEVYSNTGTGIIMSTGSANIVKNNNVHDNESGISIGGADEEVRDNTVLNNNTTENSAGIIAVFSSGAQITGNLVQNSQFGIRLLSSYGMLVADNNVENSAQTGIGVGAWLFSPGDMNSGTFERNRITNSTKAGMYMTDGVFGIGNKFGIHDLVIRGNYFENPGVWDLHVDDRGTSYLFGGKLRIGSGAVIKDMAVSGNSFMGGGVQAEANKNLFCVEGVGNSYGEDAQQALGECQEAIAPIASNRVPTDGSWSNDASQPISVTLSDAASGINASSIVLNVEGVDYTTASAEMSYDAGTGILTFTPSVAFSDAQVVSISLAVSDNAGNWLMPPTAGTMWSFTIDATAPVNASIIIDDSDGYTTDTTPLLLLSVEDYASGVANMMFSCDDASWSAPVAYAVSYDGVDITDPALGCTTEVGEKTVYAQFQDAAGNWSASVSDSTVLT